MRPSLDVTLVIRPALGGSEEAGWCGTTEELPGFVACDKSLQGLMDRVHFDLIDALASQGRGPLRYVFFDLHVDTDD